MGISAIASKGYHYFTRGMKIAPDFILGTGNEKFSQVLADSFYGARNAAGKRVGGQHFKNFWSQFKNAAKAAENQNLQNVAANGGFWKNMWHQIKTTPALLKSEWKAGAQAAKAASKNSIWGGLKGSVKAIGKRLPLLGSLLMIAFELPNICSATKDKGLWAGIKETVKSSARIGGGMLGAAIGTALIPIPVVGSIIGYMVGDKLTSLVTGKSYSEKKMEAEAKIAEQQEQLAQQAQRFDTGTTNPFATMQPTLSIQELMQLNKLLYGNGAGGLNDDLMYMAMMNNMSKN